MIELSKDGADASSLLGLTQTDPLRKSIGSCFSGVLFGQCCKYRKTMENKY
jgi:hypothetical protein